MPTVTMTEPTALPTEEQYETASKALALAIEALVAVRWRVWRVSTFHGESVPTFEEMGRVLAFIEGIRRYVDEIESNFKTLKDALPELDYVRLCENVNPDPPDDAMSSREFGDTRTEGA